MTELDTDIQKWADELIHKMSDIENADKLPSIYFVGKAGSGKSYNAKFMIKKYGYQVAKFAYPVYMLCEKYFDMKEKDRKLMQVLGTDVGRDMIDPDIWVKRFSDDMKIVFGTAKKLGLPTPRFVMDDCRFPNEHKVLKELGFVGIYLDVPDDIRKERLVGRDGSAQDDTLNHKSEMLVDSFKDDLIRLDASNNLEDNYIKLSQILAELLREYEND